MKTLIITLSLSVGALLAYSQEKKSVVIGTMINRPNALLVINPPNSNQGFLLPQLDSKQRESISPSSPDDDGLLVFDTSEKSFYHWNNGAWIRGLGGEGANQSISYDPGTRKLTLSGGGETDLSTLKEIPTTAGNTGRFLTTDGTTLSWATVNALGDITGIITGSTSGLSGGSTSGDATLSVNTDGTTISVNGTNQLQLSNSAVTSSKISPGAVTSSHIADGSVTGTDIQDNSVSTGDIANGAITSPKISNGAVATNNILSGGNNKVLTTTGTGTVVWTDQSALDTDDQNLSLSSNVLNIDGGTSANLNGLIVNGQVTGTLNSTVIQPNTIGAANIIDGTISSQDIASGGNDKVLTTDAVGTVTWANRSAFVDDNQTLTFSGNTLTVQDGNAVNLSAAGQVAGLLDNLVITPGSGSQIMVTNPGGTATQWVTPAGDISGPITNLTIQPNAVSTIEIQDGTIAATDIASGGNDKVLTTDAVGTVTWANRSAFVDDNQTLSFSGNTLTVQDGNAVNLNAAGQVAGLLDNLVITPGSGSQVMVTNPGGTATQWVTPAGDISGPITNLAIQPNAVSTTEILDGTIVATDIASTGLNKVLTTDATGSVTWADRSTFTDDNQNLSLSGSTLTIDNGNAVALSTSGQVSGPIDNLTITPGVANQVLVTNGAATSSQWVTPGGDITGPMNNAVVTRIQGNNVSTAVPNVGDALVWNGTEWTPLATSGTPSVQYLAVDPSDFAALMPNGGQKEGTGLLESNEGQFVFAMNESRTITAPVHLPDGAVVQSMILYYEYTLLLGILGPVELTLVRKPLGGGASQVLATITPLLSIGVFSNSTTVTHTIDNSVNSYRLIATFTNLSDADQASEALQRIYGVRLQYLK